MCLLIGATQEARSLVKLWEMIGGGRVLSLSACSALNSEKQLSDQSAMDTLDNDDDSAK